jgi:hypothetical protein
LRDEGFTVGRLDSRYKGIDRKDAGDEPNFNAGVDFMVAFLYTVDQYVHSPMN